MTVITRKLCIEANAGIDNRLYKDCMDQRETKCLWEDQIQICYRDDIDGAQAMCRHFGKGDAFGSVASATKSIKAQRTHATKGMQRTLLAYLKCPKHPDNLESCQIEYLPNNVTRCPQMVAHCYLSNCWQKERTIRERSTTSGKNQYGQACHFNMSSLCAKDCIRCPPSWQGNLMDGDICYSLPGDSLKISTLH